MRYRRVVVGLVVALAVIVGVAWYGLHSVSASIGYDVQAEFAEVPADHRELEAWLRAQPGVWSASVKRKPAGKNVRLEVFIGLSRNLLGQPPIPDLSAKCAELGYRGQAGPFRDRDPDD